MASELRKNMNQAIKEVIVPVLREQGFKGSFPHFRRKNNNNIDLLTFQFNRYGGSFVVELAVCPLDGVTMSWGEKVPPNKVTAHDVNERYRLGAKTKNDPGIWFDFENAKTKEDFEQITNKVLKLLHTEDETWITNILS